MNISHSQVAFEQARQVIVGGVNSPVRSFKSVGGNPIFIDRGQGCFLWDVDGNRYVDFCGSWGPMILGHVHPQVEQALRSTLSKGTTFGAPTVLETHLASLVCQAIPSIQRIRFVSSGTEAAMSAIRLARAFTGRTKIIKFDGGYHGHADHLLVAAGSGLAGTPTASSAGVPADFAAQTLSVPFNNVQAVEQLFAENPDQIAAVIVEPVPANMGVVLPRAGYLQFLRHITQHHQSLLIFDEVITGFRLAWGGAQALFGITPDLTVLGKIVGGGLPVGAFGGRRDIMEMLAPLGPVYQAGTLSGNPLAMSAGIATLEVLGQPGVYQALQQRADEFLSRLRRQFRGCTINAIGSMFTLFFTPQPVEDYQQALASDTSAYARFYHAALEQGVYLAPAQFEANFISIAHDTLILAETADRLASVILS